MGAAPGVGKTYEMLQTARARKKDGYDIVVGVVETHGRKETKALLKGLGIILAASSNTKGVSSRKWTSMRSLLDGRRSCSSTSWPTPTLGRAVIPSAISTSRSC